jgi:FkbM family methyltransferase
MDHNKNNYNIIILFFLIIFILFIFFYLHIENFIDIDKYSYYDENNNKINHLSKEIDEQHMANEYIDPHDIVLELGARYGTVSVIISEIVKNKGKLVSVEPDPTVYKALLDNKNKNNANFEILNKLISNKSKKLILDGYSTRTVDSDTNDGSCITYNNFKKLYPYKFNVLIADCEGCLYEFIEMLGDDLNNYNKILFEADQPQICNYDKIIQKLHNNGFTQVNKRFNVVDRYYFKRL